MGGFDRNLSHLQFNGQARPETYTNPRRGGATEVPRRDRAAHANALLASLDRAIEETTHRLAPNAAAETQASTFYLQFHLPPGTKSFVDSLEDRRKGIELASAKSGDDGLIATVRIPFTAADHFRRKILRYRDEQTRSGRPKNEDLVSRLESVEVATLKSLYTDATEFPADNIPLWWEVWISGRRDSFAQEARRAALRVSQQTIHFPEQDVLLAFGTAQQLARVMVNSGAISEVRRATDTPATFVNMTNIEQREWAGDLANRVADPAPGSPSVCLLDSGITREHILLARAVGVQDVHRYDPNWPAGDSDQWGGHGTRMAGLALYGDLQDPLLSNRAVALSHCLESVTILDPAGNQHDPKLYGAITQEAIARAETQAPHRTRVICMAVTSTIDTLRGRPSSWSAALDSAAFGDHNPKRLIIVSAGNIRNNLRSQEYLDRNDAEPIENPAQAWNAISVGGFTRKVTVNDPALSQWVPVAATGDLAPTSRTSVPWDREWPIKPDVVFEAGNVVTDGQICSVVDDVSLISTHHRPSQKQFEILNETSAATALAANFAARLSAARAQSWPETIRALMIHSAEWTPEMKARFARARRQTEKLPLFRRYGYGVPDFGRARFSALNDLTLIAEDELQPFWKHDSQVKTRHMNLYSLPWPRRELEQMGEAEVQLRVTLSYFVEPNPGERGWTRRHRYASHGLRFALKRSTESVMEFRARINRAVQIEEDEFTAEDETDNWYLGMLRDSGSIHSDYWTGPAAELASRNALGVFPVTGWWKEKPALERYNRRVRYSLLITIRAATAAIDIYTPVRLAIQTPIEVLANNPGT